MITETKFPAHGVTVTLYRQVERGTLYAYFSVGKARYRPNLKTSDLKAAKDAAREEVEKAHNEPKNRSADKRTFKELTETYWRDRWPECVTEDRREFLSELPTYNTFRGVRGILHAMHKNFGNNIPARMTLADAIAFTQRIIDKQENGRTAVNHREALRGFYRWLRRQQLVPWESNPCESELLEMPSLEDPEPDPLSDDAVRALIPLAKKNPIWPVFLLCLGAGCRPIEAVRVHWEDIDLEKKFVSVVNRKGKRVRKRGTALNSWLCEELAALPRSGDKPFSFTRDTACHMMKEVSDLTGVPATLQQLRQTACTKAILSGMKLVDYVQNFGHSLAVAERHYLRLGVTARAEGMEALNFK